MKLKDYLENYNKKDIYPFHMPGHKRMGEYPYTIDVTEVENTDNLYHPKDILQDTINKAQEYYGTRHSLLLTNGSTTGILASVSGCTNPGDLILMARNCHKSVYNAVELKGLKPSYVYPVETPYEFGGEILIEDIENSLKENTGINTVVITSPTYEGVVSDIEGIAKVCHQNNAILIVDEAHGSHLHLDDYFPKSAVSLGADIVIHSLHKTLPALTSCGLLHICSERVEFDRINKFYSMFQTSSPSYVLMSSIDSVLTDLLNGNYDISAYINNINSFIEKCKKFKNIKLINENNFNYFDRSKLTFSLKNCSIRGVELQNILRNNYNLETEMACSTYLVAMTSVMDTQRGFDRLFFALSEIDKTIKKAPCSDNMAKVTPEYYCSPGECDTLKGEVIPLSNSQNKIVKEYIYAYPPGIPIVVPGEVINSEILEYINYLKTNKVNLMSDKEKYPNSICVAIDSIKNI